MAWRNEITRNVITAVYGMGKGEMAGCTVWVPLPNENAKDWFMEMSEHVSKISDFIHKEFMCCPTPAFAELLGIPIPADVEADRDGYCFIAITNTSLQPRLEEALNEDGMTLKTVFETKK
jgi:hypothetical protein